MASATVLVGLFGIGGGGLAWADGGGNSTAAHACQQGGYSSLMGTDGVTDVASFSNTGDCVSYAAQGGTLVSTEAAVPCLDGGYANLTTAGGTTAFASEAACVLYVAEGGVPTPVAPPPPTISSISASGYPGTTVITGTNFVDVTAVVYGANGPAPVVYTVDSPNQITVTPALYFYYDTCYVQVTTTGGTATYNTICA